MCAERRNPSGGSEPIRPEFAATTQLCGPRRREGASHGRDATQITPANRNHARGRDVGSEPPRGRARYNLAPKPDPFTAPCRLVGAAGGDRDIRPRCHAKEKRDGQEQEKAQKER
jgi:hypothetical protein